MAVLEVVDDQTIDEFDWGPYNLSPKALAYAKARLRGLNQWRSAEAAGYTGENAHLRTTGSRLENQPKIRIAMDAARTWCGLRSETPLDDAEIEKEIARSVRRPTSPTEKIQALKLAQDRQDRRAARTDAEAHDPLTLINSLVVARQFSDEFIAEFAMTLGLSPEKLACSKRCSLLDEEAAVLGGSGRNFACVCPPPPYEWTEETIDAYRRAFRAISGRDGGDSGRASPFERAAASGAGADSSAAAAGADVHELRGAE